MVAHSPPCTRHTVARTERRGLWGGANSARRRCRRRRSKLLRKVNAVGPLDYADNIVDPLALALCEGARSPIWVDPMLDELNASLVVSWPTGASVRRPSPLTAASLEAQAALADTRSPPRVVQLNFADGEELGVDGEVAAVPATTTPSTTPTAPLTGSVSLAPATPGQGLATGAPAAVQPPICELEGHGYSGELEHGRDNALMTPVAQVRALPP
jgi:hypothetical protein